MSDRPVPKPEGRAYYLDNLRIYLTTLVILHHASLGYGGAGDWYGGSLLDPTVDAASAMLLPIFNGINQSYFMSAFFLLAGYFTPRSLDRKGPVQFLKDRLIRLGIPIAVYTTILANVNDYLVDVCIRGNPGRIRMMYAPGHLWFLQALLLFAIIYAAFRAITNTEPAGKSTRRYQTGFPPDAALFLCITVLTILTFAVRLAYPVGVWFLAVQPGHFVHYICCFFAGIMAYRGDWFGHLSRATARRWGIMALVAVPFLAVIGALGGGLNEPEQFMVKLFGGLHWQAFAYAAWESFLMVGVIVFLLYLFREKLRGTRPILRTMAVNVYTVYIIHATILITLQILFLPVRMPTIAKFAIVSLITVPVCFFLSSAIRKIPRAKRVLG